MNEQRNDFELLSGFAREGDQDAFAEIVRRHLDLVYATALRKAQDEGAAQEVAQNVFAALARKAWRFASDDSLPAWLYKAALLESREWLRGEMRRRRREQNAAELGTTMNTPQDEPALRALIPLLDEALLSLREKDRAALLLRFYESRPLRAVGTSLGVGEDAAQKRVAGALEKVADYFRRRGFRTATAGAVAAALERTASSAPASVANAVISAASQVAPAAILGWAGPVARLASLSKAQTVALCAALVVAPMSWEWHAHLEAKRHLLELHTQLEATRTDRAEVQTEIERYQKTTARLSAALADESSLAARRAAAADEFAAWRQRLHALLAAEDYRWPADSPFVRIPKSIVRKLETNRPVRPPGVLTQAARELLGLTSEEREQIENAFRAHFAAIDQLIDTRVYETNALAPYPSRFGIPSGAVASQVWTIPPLGDQVDTLSKGLETSLQNTLGPDRWSITQGQMGMIGTDTLRRVLNLDAAQNPQQIAVWIFDEGGKPAVGYGWQGNGGAFSRGDIPLDIFKPGPPPDSGMSSGELLGASNLPGGVVERMMNWLQQQAAALPEKEGPR